MKAWCKEHLRLAATAERIRAHLRVLAVRLPEPEKAELLRLAAELTKALKARDEHFRTPNESRNYIHGSTGPGDP